MFKRFEGKSFAERHGAGRLSTMVAGIAVGAAIGIGTLMTAPAQAEEGVIRCAYPYWFGFAPVPVASAMGYFEEEGLEVTTVFDNDRANVYPGLEIGDLDCTMRTIGEHMSRPLAEDSNFVVIGLIDISVGADGVVAAPDVNDVTDLIGRTFAGEINHPGTLMTAHALREAGHSFSDVNVRLINTDDSPAVFEDDDVAAVATWEPMMSDIVANTSREGSKILLSSADFNGLITDVVIVNKEDYEADREKYAAFMRGIYRAVDLYNNDPEKFLEVAAPAYEVTPEQMKVDIEGVYYTSYEDAVEYFGTDGQPAKLADVVNALNDIQVELDLMDAPISMEAMSDPSLTDGLFDGKTR